MQAVAVAVKAETRRCCCARTHHLLNSQTTAPPPCSCQLELPLWSQLGRYFSISKNATLPFINSINPKAWQDGADISLEDYIPAHPNYIIARNELHFRIGSSLSNLLKSECVSLVIYSKSTHYQQRSSLNIFCNPTQIDFEFSIIHHKSNKCCEATIVWQVLSKTVSHKVNNRITIMKSIVILRDHTLAMI